MRVAFDVHTLGQGATGNETYAEGLLEMFLREPPPGIEFVFYETGSLGERASGAAVRRLRPAWPYVRIPLVTPWALARDRIDVAHFQYIAPPIRVCPTVLTVHDLSFERHPEFFGGSMAWRMRRLIPYQVRRAAHIIAVSEATRRDLIELYGVSPARISVIYNGVPAHCRELADRDRVREALARFGLQRPFIACVGNLGARKNQAAVVRAFARLVKDRGVDHDLLLIGKATESSAAILAEIRRSGAEERIRVTGFVDRDELVALYNAARFSVYLSLHEGFGLPVVESMACGTPVLTSSVSCMPEIAGDAALLADPRDDDAVGAAMLRMIEDDDLRGRLRHAGLERAKAFSWREAAHRTAAVYRLASNGRGAAT